MRNPQIGNTVAVDLDRLSGARQQRRSGKIVEIHGDGQITAEFPQNGFGPMLVSGPPEHFIAVRTEHDGVVAAAVYWRLREHASAYRGAKAFRTTFERWRANRDDPRAYQKHVIHEFYARGIEAAAREVAELAGVTEQELSDTRPYVAVGGADRD